MFGAGATDDVAVDHRGVRLPVVVLFGHRVHSVLLSLLLCRGRPLSNVSVFGGVRGTVDLSEFIQYAAD